MKRLMVSTLALCALMAAAWPSVHAAGTKGAQPEWVSQKFIEANKGFKLTVGKLGTFRIKSVRPATPAHTSCLVHVPSVRALITQGVSEGTLDFAAGVVRVELKVRTCPKGLADAVLQSEDDDGSGGSDNGGGDDDDDEEEEELCCKGGGKGCVADIERLP